MDRNQTWKNFDLGKELTVSGNYIYNGLLRFHELETLEHTDEIFEVFYSLAIGIERLFKVAIILHEHGHDTDQGELEESLKTHDHTWLRSRLENHFPLNLDNQHIEFLSILTTFYGHHRYGRYRLTPAWEPDQEKLALRGYLTKHADASFPDDDGIMAAQNDDRYRKHLCKLVGKIARQGYSATRKGAEAINLYTYELRSGSKAESIFLAEEPSFINIDILRKELLVYLMNTKPETKALMLINSFEPLEFDEACLNEYIRIIMTPEAAPLAMGMLEMLYQELPDTGQRIEMMDFIGSTIYFVDDDPEQDDDF